MLLASPPAQTEGAGISAGSVSGSGSGSFSGSGIESGSGSEGMGSISGSGIAGLGNFSSNATNFASNASIVTNYETSAPMFSDSTACAAGPACPPGAYDQLSTRGGRTWIVSSGNASDFYFRVLGRVPAGLHDRVSPQTADRDLSSPNASKNASAAEELIGLKVSGRTLVVRVRDCKRTDGYLSVLVPGEHNLDWPARNFTVTVRNGVVDIFWGWEEHCNGQGWGSVYGGVGEGEGPGSGYFAANHTPCEDDPSRFVADMIQHGSDLLKMTYGHFDCGMVTTQQYHPVDGSEWYSCGKETPLTPGQYIWQLCPKSCKKCPTVLNFTKTNNNVGGNMSEENAHCQPIFTIDLDHRRAVPSGAEVKGGTAAECAERAPSCEPCEAGTFKLDAGQMACDLCPAGKFASRQGATSCLNCAQNSVSSPGSDQCSCAEGYYGSDCQKHCDAWTTCSGRGSCNENGECVCYGEFAGHDCSLCSNGMAGPECEKKCDQNTTCGGNGVCLGDGSCGCSDPYSGPDCSVCVTGLFGANCEFECGPDSCSNRGNLHPRILREGLRHLVQRFRNMQWSRQVLGVWGV